VKNSVKRLLGIYFVCLCYLAAGVYAQELYRWVDEKGGVHFTDNFDSIPQKYRDKVERREFPSPAKPPASLSQPQTGKSQPAHQLQRFVIPFKRGEHNHIIVEGTVNGKGTGKFYLDTGAGETTIPESLAQQSGIDPDKGIMETSGGVGGSVTVPTIEIDSLKVGGAEVRDLLASIMDLSSGSDKIGLLGADFLLEFGVNIDYTKNEVTLERKESPYEGHTLEWWQHRFRRYHGLKKEYEDVRSKAGSQKGREWLDKQLRAVEEKIAELEIRASRAGVPRKLRQ
jgi:predicted aspartyl protease